MMYLIPALLVLLIVGGFVTFMALNAAKKSGPAADGKGEGPPGIGGDDAPLGDTSEHAGSEAEDGTTVGDVEGGAPRMVDPDSAAHVGRPGDGEGRVALEFEGKQPAPAPTTAAATEAPTVHEATDAAADAAPDDPDAQDAAPEDDPPKPASERLADRPV